jgi:glucose 1-dehydrogenase
LKLKGSNAIVTGGARGIGQAIAVEFAREGANVTILDVAKDADATMAEVGALGGRALFIRGSVADRDAVTSAIETTAVEFGSVDILVNNAVRSRRAPLLELDPEDVRLTWDVTLWGVLHGSQLAARRMVAQGRGGNIISISSVHAYRPYPGASAYNAAKAAVNHMSATWAVELAPHGIRVNVIEPGWIDTPGEHETSTDEQLKEAGPKLLMGRLGEPREIARGAVYLASADASYVTGSVLRIDGGFVLPR